MKHNKDERGVAFVLEIILIALVLAAVGFAVYSTMHAKKSQATTSPSPSKSVSSAPNPTAGWLNYKSNYEGLSFKYPSSWKLNVSTQTVAGWTDVDTVTVTSGTGFKITLFSHVQGIGGACGGGECPFVQTISEKPSSTLQGIYIIGREIRNPDNKTVIQREVGLKEGVNPSNQSDIPAVGTVQEFPYYLIFPSRGVDKTLASFVGSYPDNSQYLKLSTVDFFNLPDVKTGQQIIESASY